MRALRLMGSWYSGITSASHAEGPGLKSQCVHVCATIPARGPTVLARRSCCKSARAFEWVPGLNAGFLAPPELDSWSLASCASAHCAAAIPRVGLHRSLVHCSRWPVARIWATLVELTNWSTLKVSAPLFVISVFFHWWGYRHSGRAAKASAC